MKIVLGCDHAGFPHKGEIIRGLKGKKHEVIDLGCNCSESCDYPPIARSVARAVAKGEADKGVLICGSGVGMSIAANKIKGIRAAFCWSKEIAPLISQHNMANIICLPGRFASAKEMLEWIDIWLNTLSSSEPRHKKRIEEISEIEKEYMK